MITDVFIENFKAIYRVADFPIQPFTVFIGNNGSGKSSIMEALRVLQIAVENGLNKAFEKWGGLNRIRNYNATLNMEDRNGNTINAYSPLTIGLTAVVNKKNYTYRVSINTSADGVYYIVEHEELTCNGSVVFTASVMANKSDGEVTFHNSLLGKAHSRTYNANALILGLNYSPRLSDEIEEFTNYITDWQFLYLDAHLMGEPVTQERVYRTVKLNYDGRNIADHLLWLKNQGQEYIDSLVRKMQFVLPYINDIQPHVLGETINREVELLLHESKEKSEPLPGWLLSSGTLRVLALLCMFDTPLKPSVLFIDEIENGLDPRTIGLLLSEIESEFANNGMQVIVTTHSPYFLDLISLESIIVSEKNEEGSKYHIPKDQANLDRWREKFTPGKLYTIGKLTN